MQGAESMFMCEFFIETFVEEVKPLTISKLEFEYQDTSLLKNFWSSRTIRTHTEGTKPMIFE